MRHVLATLLIAAAAGTAGAQPARVPRDAVNELGRQLYERGRDELGRELSASMGEGSWVLRGASVACANCHGIDGTGGGEGRQLAPDLRWPAWQSPDAATRRRALHAFGRAVGEGRGQQGQALSTAMPRFNLDEAARDALAHHVRGLAAASPRASAVRLAMLSLNDAAQTPIERAIHDALAACLHQRLGARVALERASAADAREAAAVWTRWRRDESIVAALVPPWRGWSPADASPAPQRVQPLPVLFPLGADPDPEAAKGDAVSWLFGGEDVRAAALVQAWLAQRDKRDLMPYVIDVWAGEPLARGARREQLERVQRRVRESTGHGVTWRLLEHASAAQPAGTTLWLDDTTDWGQLPGRWLVPQAAAAANGMRPVGTAWVAVPFMGAPPLPLHQAWAQAACASTAAVVSAGAKTRAQWRAALAQAPRVREGNGFEWKVAASEASPHGDGAVAAWSIVELSQSERAAWVVPRIDSTPERARR